MSCSICLSLTFHFKFIHVAVNHKNFLLFYGLVVFHSIYIYGIYIYIVAAERSYPGPDVRGGGREELLRAPGKEQWLHFAGAGVKRDPTSKVRETQVRR